VRVILPAPSGQDHDAPGIAIITTAGAQVHRLSQSYLYVHAKVIVVDGRRAFVGSENLSTASLDHNREVGVIVADPGAIQTLESTFDGDWAQAS
jgi:phosphatidylserine/phosphatidylglycerophosphate/cardiolipin synthase-like enzyme